MSFLRRVAAREQIEEPIQTTPPGGLSTHRIEALGDGVFAIAMTLLVLDVHLPPPNTMLLAWFLSDWPILLCYVMSFALLGVYWVSHHAHFQFIRHADRPLLWINILFLLLISFIPFTTALLGERLLGGGTDSMEAAIVYGLHIILIGCVIYLHWWYATRGHRLVNPTLEPHVIQMGARRILIGPAICLLALALAFIPVAGPFLSVACYILIPIVYILPGHIDRHWLAGVRNQHEKPAKVDTGGDGK